MLKKILKYIIITLFSIVVAKWILTIFPSNHTVQDNIKIVEIKKINEIKIDISFKNIESKIISELDDTQQDINNYINDSMTQFNKESKYRLSKEDGFLDWLFGWGTGYKLVWKKLKGLAGSNDNEIVAVENKFKSDVLQYDSILENINQYSKNRLEDFYKNITLIIINDINTKIANIKTIDNTTIVTNLKNEELPWGKYIVQTGTNTFELATLITTDRTLAVVIGSKVTTILGPKVLGIVSAKAVTIVASKVASVVGLVFVPIIDYALNEGTKKLQYDDTKIQFEDAIDEISDDLSIQLKNSYQNKLLDIKNEIAIELNKKITLKGKQ